MPLALLCISWPVFELMHAIDWASHNAGSVIIMRCTARPWNECRNKNLGDGIDYGQQQYDCLGELVSDTLSLFEQRGGEDAFINIKYMVPCYESCVNYA